MDKRYSCEEVANIYGIQVRTVWDWIRKKKLPAVRIGKQYYVSADDLRQLESKHKTVK